LSTDSRKAQFVLINESGDAVVGGRDEIARSFSVGARVVARDGALSYVRTTDVRATDNRELWRVKHKAPGRGVLRVVGAIALRAAAVYFRYCGVAPLRSILPAGRLDLYRAVNSFRWSGLNTRFGSVRPFNTRWQRSSKLCQFVESTRMARSRATGHSESTKRIAGAAGPRHTFLAASSRPREEVRESILDRLDPARQAERLAS
jgi:hypothetical protein